VPPVIRISLSACRDQRESEWLLRSVDGGCMGWTPLSDKAEFVAGRDAGTAPKSCAARDPHHRQGIGHTSGLR